jgi:hypothetical protein
MGKDMKPLKEIRGKCYSLFFIFCCPFPSAIEDRTKILSYFRVPLKKKKTGTKLNFYLEDGTRLFRGTFLC